MFAVYQYKWAGWTEEEAFLCERQSMLSTMESFWGLFFTLFIRPYKLDTSKVEKYKMGLGHGTSKILLL